VQRFRNSSEFEIHPEQKEFCAMTEILHDLNFTLIQKIHTLTEIPQRMHFTKNLAAE